MAYDAHKIMIDAYKFANIMLSQNEPLSEEKIAILKSDNILASKYGKALMENVVLGAIQAYHGQLRLELLKQGIDIGNIYYEDD